MQKSTLNLSLAFLFTFLLNTLSFYILPAQSPVFYGMTDIGGSNNLGTIFMFDPHTSRDTVLWNFGSGTDGRYPGADLVFDTSNGLFYGLTDQGGIYDSIQGLSYTGTIFSFNPVSNKENVLWSFGHGMDGALPGGSLVYNSETGLYYGTTIDGGNDSLGTIFTFDPSANSENVVWSFERGKDGRYPMGSPVIDPGTGLYYVTTYLGGSRDVGAIISFDPTTKQDSVIWSLGSRTPDGYSPTGNLTADTSNGLLYGLIKWGGANSYGAIISINPVTDSESVVWSFKGPLDGAFPYGSLVYDAGNKLFYGTTGDGGGDNNGTIFSFNPATDSVIVVWRFGGNSDGANPYGNLVYDKDSGLYYGMTVYGGIYSNGNSGGGTIFSFNAKTSTEKVLWNFGNGKDGRNPYGDLLIYSPQTATAISTSPNTSTSVTIYPNPTTGNLTITGLSSGQAVELYNYLGSKISSQPIRSTSYQLNISSQPAGMYLVLIVNSDGSITSTNKVMKMD